MSGNRRIIVGEITQGKLRGADLKDALGRELTNEQKEDGIIKRKNNGKSKKK